jgi:hypothetical protein
MSKAVKYGTNAAIVGGLGNALINAIKQLNDINKNPELKFSWKDCFIAGAKGAVVCGSAGWVVGKIADHNNANTKAIATVPILYSHINKIRLDKNDWEYRQLCQKADWLIGKLKAEFGKELSTQPYRFGSTEMGTALRDNADIDICLPLKAKFFSSTEDMFFIMQEYLESLIGVNDIVRVRNQKKSIGVFFKIRGHEEKIDILPHRITTKRGNKHSGYLYVNNNGLFQKPSYTKTNPNLLKGVALSETQKNILILLKDWKIKESLPVSSHLLQNLILDAYDYNRNCIPRNFARKVVMVLRHIADNINIAYIRSIENSNNVLTDIPAEDKRIIADACRKVVDEYEYQPNSILKMLDR